ncbi:MAG TPA: methylmalonyl-CoA mutase family protein, partial [Casimicrobiaceae bacterium]|nr:methylmalonyl-CoA mutase family protein [Casimicrobiaceae bacterium]
MSAAGPSQGANRPPGGSAAAEPHIATGASAGPDPRVREALAAQVDAWEKNEVAGFIERAPERAENFETLGGFPLKRVYTALDIADTPLDDIGLPGKYPFTRGPYPTMYRGRVWTMRQIAGFGTAEDTNQRFKYLIAHGQTGLSTDFDMPTL